MLFFYDVTWQKFSTDYLRFSKKERLAVLLFVALMVLVYLLPRFVPKPEAFAVQQDTALQKILDSATLLAQAQPVNNADETGTYPYADSKKFAGTEGALFSFDPNTLDAEGWKKLGLRDRTAQTILNYRSKGGHFYKGEDLKKIWGLPDGFYERVKAYIQIADAKSTYKSNENVFKNPYEKTERKIAVVDINHADTAALIRLPGIGSKLAQRIVAFRDKLGGFYSVEQIGETYGLPDSTFQKLKPYLQAHGVLKKFNLNTATKDELKGHPYIRWNLANAIVEYRSQHGLFKNLDALKNIVLIDEATYHKIAPYFTVE